MTEVNIDHNPSQAEFMQGVQKTLVQQEDYRGIGVHALKKHGPHGSHSQVSIGVGTNTTVNFRELRDAD